MPNVMQERNPARANVCALKVECNKLRAEIEMWRDECREWQSHTHQLRKELAKANRRYGECRAAWARLEASLREQISEAKAEIERLQCSRGYWHERCRESEHQATARARRNNAAAKKWHLVLGMRPGSRLIHVGSTEGAAEWWVGTGSIVAHAIGDDPAEALRAIQKEGDDGL